MTGEQKLERVRALVDQFGFRYFDAQPSESAVGFGVAWSKTSWVLVSCHCDGSDSVFLTCGVLKGIAQESVPALEEVNLRNRLYPFAPMFVDGTPDGWDVLQQHAVGLEILEKAPRFFSYSLEALPVFAADAIAGFQRRGLGGMPYEWNPPDLQRLLRRSVP